MSTATFFEASSPFGDLAGWEVQTGGGATQTKERASVLGASGDEITHTDHSHKHDVSANYAATLKTGNFTIPAAGSVLNGYVVESVEVSYNQETPTMTITGHKFQNMATGAYSSMRTYSPTVTLPAVAIGVPSTVGPVSTDGGKSITYRLECQHIDEAGGIDTIVGADNYDGKETLTVQAVTAITVSDANGDWTRESDAVEKSNTAATAYNLTLGRHISHDTGA